MPPGAQPGSQQLLRCICPDDPELEVSVRPGYEKGSELHKVERKKLLWGRKSHGAGTRAARKKGALTETFWSSDS